MENIVQIALDLSPETMAKIHEINFPLEEKIKELSPEIDIQLKHLQVDGEPITKDLAVIIIVSAAAAYLVMKGVALLIKEIRGGGKTLIYDQLVPLLDKNGNPVMQDDGKTPIFYNQKNSIKVEEAYKPQASELSVLSNVLRLREGSTLVEDKKNKKEK